MRGWTTKDEDTIDIYLTLQCQSDEKQHVTKTTTWLQKKSIYIGAEGAVSRGTSCWAPWKQGTSLNIIRPSNESNTLWIVFGVPTGYSIQSVAFPKSHGVSHVVPIQVAMLAGQPKSHWWFYIPWNIPNLTKSVFCFTHHFLLVQSYISMHTFLVVDPIMYMYIYIYIYIHTYIYIYTYIYMYVCMYMYIYIYIYHHVGWISHYFSSYLPILLVRYPFAHMYIYIYYTIDTYSIPIFVWWISMILDRWERSRSSVAAGASQSEPECSPGPCCGDAPTPTRWCPPSYKLVYNPNNYRYNPHKP